MTPSYRAPLKMASLYWQDDGGQTIFVSFDATISETIEDLATITDHPVEDGVVISDHARDEPPTVLIEGIITNVPMPGMDGVEMQTIERSIDVGQDRGTQRIELDIPSPPIQPSISGVVSAGISAVGRAINGKPKGTFDGPYRTTRETISASYLAHVVEGTNRPRDAYEALLDAKAKKYLITVVTPYRELSDLLIQRLAIPRGLDLGSNALKYQIDLRQIRIVTSETVKAPVPLEARGAAKKNQGAQSGTKDSDEEAKMESSLHKALF